MLKKLRNLVKTIRATHFAVASSLPKQELVLVNQGTILSGMNSRRPASDVMDCGFQVFSQRDEDGIIQKLTQVVRIEERSFIEFGVEDFSESNCRFLMMKDYWKGYVMDGSQAQIDRCKGSYYYWRHDLQAVSAYITRENVNELIGASGFSSQPGILSIDVDGVDYWLLREISIRPAILVVEFNEVFGPDRNITVPYKADFDRTKEHFSNLYFGASLGAINQAAVAKGYVLAAVNKGVNAFFVRSDLLEGTGLVSISVQAAYHPPVFCGGKRKEKSMQKNLFAYTEPGSGLPAYVSINRRDDQVFLSVRSRGGSSVAEVELPSEQIAALRRALKPSIGKLLIGS